MPAGAEGAVWFGAAAIPTITILVQFVKTLVPGFPARYSGALALLIGVTAGAMNAVWGGDTTQIVDSASVVEGGITGITAGFAAIGVHEGSKTSKFVRDVGDGIGGD
jgi:hypothetical protein